MTCLIDAAGRLLGPGGRAFTAEQAEVVTRRDGPLLVAANAGSGKTSVLVERFVRSVAEDGLRPNQILAITFTEKAAGELRARVRERFLELGRREDARDTEGAWVSTIHGFCARVLRAHAVAAGLDPSFAVLDEPAARALRRRAFETALAAFLGDPEARDDARVAQLELAAAYTPDRLETMIGGVHEELRSRGMTRPALPVPVAADLAAARAELAAAAAAAREELVPARSLTSIDRARAAVDRCLALLAAGGEPPGAAALGELAFRPGQVDELATAACERYRRARDGFARACADARALPVVALLDELLGLYAAAYAEAKRERSAVDFSDLELRARDLFDAAPAVAAGYAEQFRRVMVDEFQDTNPLQLDLIDRLDRDALFVVGDELQSIYGFRHADVRGFQRRRKAHEAAGTAAALATNFRSRAEILHTLNAAFGEAHGPDYVPLVAGRDDPPAHEPLVELLLTDAPAWDAQPDAATAVAAREGLGAARSSLAAEARLVAGRVRELVDAGECEARDVVVLLRAVANLPVFERALEDAGFATLPSASRGWWGRREVLDLSAHLGALANPRDEAALLGLLASPLVGLSSDGLALMAMARTREGGLWAAAEAAFCGGGAASGEGAASALAARLPPADRERLAAFCPWFAAERREAPRRGISELLERAVLRSGYDLHVLGLAGGRRRLANVHKLMRLADAFEAGHGRDLRGFIDHARAELDAAATEADAPVDLGDQDAVRLMTIHAAKGLEFGVVVVAELGRQGAERAGDLLVRDGRLGVRLVGLDGTKETALAYDGLRDELRAAEAEEERRVLHVAMTRASERLILSGATDPAKGWPAERPGGCPLAYLGPRVSAQESVRVVHHAPPEQVAAGGETPARPDAAPAAPNEAPTPPGEAPAAGEQLTLALGDAMEQPPAGEPAMGESAAPAEPPAPPAPPGPRPVRALSYSSLSQHAACSYRFYLERVLGLPEQEPPPGLVADAPGLEARLRGTLAHELLEHVDLAPGAAPPGRDEVVEVAAAHGIELDGPEVDDLCTLVEAFAASEVRRRLGRAAWVRREHAFAFPLLAGDPAGPLLNGVVDVLAREPSGAMLVVDHKTDRVGDADLEELVERAYGVQRRIYALAALRAGAPAVEVVHLFLEAGDAGAVSARYVAADAAALQAELAERASGLLAGEYPVTAAPHAALCATCPGRDGLCSWPPEMTDRPPPEAVEAAPADPA